MALTVTPIPGDIARPVILSYGLGVDSTAILLRWLTDPTSRDFALRDLTVVTAMTGDEWDETGQDVESAILPLLRDQGVRFVQVARSGRYVTADGDGVTVLCDSRSTRRVLIDGAYRLSQEMTEAGTVPQSGGARLCSVHAKGDALDPTIAALVGDRPYRHVIGFEAGEPKRAAKDALFNTAQRTGEYPLIEWGWDRATCEEFILQATGIAWRKSACKFCPFALANAASRAATLARYAERPDVAAEVLMMERRAIALNPAQGLIGGRRLLDAIGEIGDEATLDYFYATLEATPHAVYEVRRIVRPRKDDPTKMANASRSVRVVMTGTKAEAEAHLGAERGPDGIARVWVRRRGETLPALEHFYVVAPAGAVEKQIATFDEQYEALVDVEGAAAVAAAAEGELPELGQLSLFVA